MRTGITSQALKCSDSRVDSIALCAQVGDDDCIWIGDVLSV